MSYETTCKIITVCGPLKFKDEIMKTYTELSLAHNIVFIPVFDIDDLKENDFYRIAILTDIHLEKISMSDAIVVVNQDGYFGEATAMEIRRAATLAKRIVFKFGKDGVTDTYKQLLNPPKINYTI